MAAAFVAAGAGCAAWAGLHLGLGRRSFELRTAVVVTFVLVTAGVVGTFPTFFQAFASE